MENIVKHLPVVAGAMLVALSAITSSCENDNINPYDYSSGGTDTIYVQTSDGYKTDFATYPYGSLVWSHDTTLTQSFKVPVGKSLYIEPGVTVTMSSTPDQDNPVELVVLGNLYCLGTEEKPVIITSDSQTPAAWGGIICGFESEEVVLSHVEIAYAGGTPTESSISFQNKLFKTTIDGGVPAFHFCNTNGKFTISHCFFHDNYNDQTYFTGGNGVITGNIFADSGNAADGGEAINVKSGCQLDIAYNLIYNACTNAFKLSNSGTSETLHASDYRIYNNTMVDCGWRRSKNKKGGSIWVEKGTYGTIVNNIVYDCRYGMRQPAKDGPDLENSTYTPNYYFASTEAGVEQMAKDYKLIVYYDSDIHSTTAGENNPLFVNFSQNPSMDINCEVDDEAKGAPLPYSSAWDFHLQSTSPALSGGALKVERIFPNGLAFLGMKSVTFNDASNDQNYYFCCPGVSSFYGAYSLN